MKCRTFLTLLFISICGPAWAVPVNFYVQGIVTDAEAGNAFGLDVDDIVSASGMFDADLPLNAGVNFGLGSGNVMTLLLGDIVLNETNDIDYLDGIFPLLEFDAAGDFQGFDLVVDYGENGGPVDFDATDAFWGEDANGYLIEGVWDLDSFTLTTKVPEPSVLALFGIGLVVLGFIRRNRAI